LDWDTYPFPMTTEGLDFRPLLEAVVRDRIGGRARSQIARSFQRGVAAGLVHAVVELCRVQAIDTVALSGGVFQNELLLVDIRSLLEPQRISIWTNHAVPPNDGGISLGQAALASFGHFNHAKASALEGAIRA
jgi:hydrogenase maturation protein HypF